MPFKSKAQMKMMFAKHPDMASAWAHETPDTKHLPEHVAAEKKKRRKPRVKYEPKGEMQHGKGSR